MDLNNLDVRRVPGGVAGWNMEEQGVLTNSLLPLWHLSSQPITGWASTMWLLGREDICMN